MKRDYKINPALLSAFLGCALDCKPGVPGLERENMRDWDEGPRRDAQRAGSILLITGQTLTPVRSLFFDSHVSAAYIQFLRAES